MAEIEHAATLSLREYGGLAPTMRNGAGDIACGRASRG